MIEQFGTGICRIQEYYSESKIKPNFEIGENSIKITLSVLQENNSLSEDANLVYQLVKERVVSSSCIVKATGFGKTKVVTILKKLVKAGFIHSVGTRRGTKYTME